MSRDRQHDDEQKKRVGDQADPGTADTQEGGNPPQPVEPPTPPVPPTNPGGGATHDPE